MPSSMEKLFQCGKCHQSYDLLSKRPKLLVCHHCFCMQCIQASIKNKTNQVAECPKCKKVTSISRNGVAALPDNEYLLPQLKLKKSSAGGSSSNTNHKNTNGNNNSGDDIFCSGSEEEDSDDSDDSNDLYDEACGGIIPNGTTATLPVKPTANFNRTENVRIFCQTCLKVAGPNCIIYHQICNYDSGVSELQNRLYKAVQKAGENLFNEVQLLEKNCKIYNQVQNAWSSIGQLIDQMVMSQTVALSSAKSLLDKLPDPTLGSHMARYGGNPSILAKAVVDTEQLTNNSSTRLQHTQNLADIWKALSKCNVQVQTPIKLPITSEGTTFPMEFTAQAKHDTTCLLFTLSKLLEGRLLDLPAPQTTATKNPNNVLKPKENLSNGNVVKLPTKKSTEDFVTVTSNKKVTKPISKGHVYCYFDLQQNNRRLGRVIFEINYKAAPKMSKNFIELCTGEHGFGYHNCKLWKVALADHVDGGDIEEGGTIGGCSIYGKKPFLGDASSLQDAVGALRMRGRGTADDGQPIIGSQFMIWVKERQFKNYSRTLVFGRVTEGLEILVQAPVVRKAPPMCIYDCGKLD